MKNLSLTLVALGWLLAVPQSARPADGAKPGDGADQAEPESPHAEAYTHFLLAREHERMGDVDAALKEYHEAITRDPGTVAVRVALASLLAETHHVAEAMDSLREALRTDPTDVPAHRMLALLLLRLRGEPHGDAYEHDVRVAFQELVDLSPDDLDARRTLGKLAYEEKDLKGAQVQLEKVIEQQPDDTESRVVLAKIYFQLQDYAKAADVYVELENGEGVPDKEKSGQILTYLFADRFEDAIKVADEGLKHVGQDSTDYLKLLKLKGLAADGMSDFALAVKTFRQLLEQDPSDREARYRLAQALQRRRDLDGAVTELEKVRQDMEANAAMSEDDPPLSQVLFTLGTVLQDKKRYADAVKVFQDALKLTEDQPRLRPAIVERLGRALFDQGQKAEAFSLLESTRAGHPELADLAVEQAELIYRDGRVKDAKAILKGYLDAAHDKKNKASYLLVGDMFLRLQKSEEALTILQDARKLFPEDEDVLFLVGSAFERNSKLDAAEKAFKRLIEVNPKSDRALNYLGYMLADKGIRLDDSLAYIKRAIELDANNGAYLDSLGWVYFKRGQLDLALDSLKRAVDEISDDPVIQDHLAEVYSGLHRFDDAVETWQRALDLGAEQPEAIKRKLEDAQAKRTAHKD